jgi:hypothetical protein
MVMFEDFGQVVVVDDSLIYGDLWRRWRAQPELAPLNFPPKKAHHMRQGLGDRLPCQNAKAYWYADFAARAVGLSSSLVVFTQAVTRAMQQC